MRSGSHFFSARVKPRGTESEETQRFLPETLSIAPRQHHGPSAKILWLVSGLNLGWFLISSSLFALSFYKRHQLFTHCPQTTWSESAKIRNESSSNNSD